MPRGQAMLYVSPHQARITKSGLQDDGRRTAACAVRVQADAVHLQDDSRRWTRTSVGPDRQSLEDQANGGQRNRAARIHMPECLRAR